MLCVCVCVCVCVRVRVHVCVCARVSVCINLFYKTRTSLEEYTGILFPDSTRQMIPKHGIESSVTLFPEAVALARFVPFLHILYHAETTSN